MENHVQELLGEVGKIERKIAERKEFGFGSVALVPRLERFHACLLTSTKVADFLWHSYYRTKDEEIATKAKGLYNCARHLVFRHFYTVGEIKLTQLITCQNHLLCAFCALRRGVKLMRSYFLKWLEIRDDKSLHLMTLTVKNGEDLEERTAHLRACFKKLIMKGKDARRGKSSSCMGKVTGGVSAIEVTHEGRGYHPHIHALVTMAVGDVITKDELEKEWLKISKDSFICDIRPVRSDDNESQLGGFAEVFKYALKFSTMTPAKVVEAAETFAGRRMVNSWGVFWGVKISEDDADEIDDWLADQPYLEFIYRHTLDGYVEEEALALEFNPRPKENLTFSVFRGKRQDHKSQRRAWLKELDQSMLHAKKMG